MDARDARGARRFIKQDDRLRRRPLDFGFEPLERIAQHLKIDRLRHWIEDLQVERLADAHGLAARRVVAALTI